MSKEKQTRKNFNEYQKLMRQKFDLEDRKANIYNEKWKLTNENAQCSKQLMLVEDQIRLMFNRMRIEKEEESS